MRDNFSKEIELQCKRKCTSEHQRKKFSDKLVHVQEQPERERNKKILKEMKIFSPEK